MPIADQIVLELDGTQSKSVSIMLITIWELGEAAGPLLIAPLSEIYGRYPIFNVANTGFIFGIILAAISRSTGLLIFARFLTGLSVASNVLNPSIIGDIFPNESRSTGMALVAFAPLIGGAIGPAASGIFAEYLGWRNFLWMCALIAIICEILFLTLLRETYKIAILEKRAARLRQETQNKSLKCAWEAEDAKKTSWSTLKVSISRPFALFIESSVLRIMSIYGGLCFSYFYIMATTLPGILRDTYGFSPALIGYSYFCFSKSQVKRNEVCADSPGIGSTSAIVLCSLFIDRVYIKLGKSRGGAIPENRLPFFIGGAFCLPAVVALYGWAPFAGLPAWVLLLSVSCLGLVLVVMMIPLASYIVDSFGIYSASAMTMVLIARCLSGMRTPRVLCWSSPSVC